jgi:ABC-type antimicrobial peptide transport system permease subunit
MLKNYFRIAIRSLLRTKSFSLINITGLVMGIACSMLICLWIYNEISYDSFHKKGAQLYQLWNRGTFDNKLQCWNSVPKPLASALKLEYPGIENSCRTDSRWFVTMAGDKKISTKALIADPSFLSMFSFPLVKGNMETALNDVYSIVITEKMAAKMFGAADPMEKTILIDGDNFKVTGVLKDLPLNSSFDFEYILPWQYYKKLGYDDDNWGNNSVNAFIQLKPGTSEQETDIRIRDITKRHTAGKEQVEVFLHPLRKWHLYSEFENGKITGGRIEIVRLFGIIAGFILLIACINFMNLSTARNEKRAKEVGIRKVAGALRRSLIGQFLLESVILVVISGMLALLLVLLVLPAFNTLIAQELELPYKNFFFWAVLLVFILITGLLAGSYPAFFLSSFNPVGVFKGTFRKAGSSINQRKVLVVLQFCIAITLIISTVIVIRQINYARNRHAGFTGNLLMYLWNTGDLNKNYKMVKNELLSSGIASSVTRTASQLTEQFSSTTAVFWKGKDANNDTEFERGAQDEGLVRTAGLRLIQGRDLDLDKYPSDSTAMLINESAMKVMAFTDPIGQIVRDGTRDYHVVGVFRDYIFDSPYERTKPMIIIGPKNIWFNIMHIRLAQSDDVMKQILAVEKVYKKYNPNYPFEYHFVDQDYALKFEDMRRIARLTALFAILTVFISCLGLFGLASYMAEERVKEIGIRKVLGASVIKITTLLTKDFLILVIIALLLASPIAWYFMHRWLQGYTYRTLIHWWVFAGTGVLVLIISLLTTGFHAIRAAMSNPVKSLRAE